MGVVTSIADRLGFNPAVRAVASGNTARALTALPWESPWADAPLGQVTLENLYSSVSPFIATSRDAALKLSVVAKAQWLVSLIGRMPLSNADAATGAKLPFTSSLLRQPERGRPRSLTLSYTADALFFHPTTWWVVTERDYYGWPSFVQWVPRKDAKLDSDGQLIGAFGKPVASADVIEFTSVDGGFLSHGGDTIKRAIILQRAVARAEANPVPSIDLHWDGDTLTNDQIDEMIDRWVAARNGGKGVGFTSKGLTANALGQSAEQLLIDGRKQIDVELARHTGFPAWALDVEVNAGGALTYSNPASRWRDLLNIGADPIMTAITDRLSMPDVTPSTQAVQFDTDRFTRDDMQTRFTAYKTGVDGGFVTTDQIKEWEGWA